MSGWKHALTREEEQRLVVDHEDGFSNVALAKRYGISESTVYRILADNDAPKKFMRANAKRKPRRAVAKGRTLQPCGTNAAYSRHKRNGEYPCPPCLEAHAAQQKAYEERKRSEGSG